MRLITALLAVALLLPATAFFAHAEDPTEAVSEAEIEKLVDQLGHDDFKIRENASRRLAKLGDQARTALEKAAQGSKSLEARWRAQQLLRRLGGAEAPKPVDTAEEEEEQQPRGRGNPFGIDEDEVARMKKMIDDWTKRFRDQFDKDDWRGTQPFGTRLFPMGKVKAPGLELVRGPQGVKLVVIDDSAAQGEARKTYEGKSLEAILEANPELKDHASMAELQSKSKNPFKQLEELLGKTIRLAPGSFPGMRTITSSSGVEITQDANGAKVKLKEKDENGEWVTKEYTGRTLDEIKEKHPHLKEKLDGMTVEFRFGKPQVFGLDRFRRPQPKREVTPSRGDTVLFGVGFETPDEILSMHLGLEKGEGALVQTVVPGSQADEVGVERGDIIIRVDQERIVNGAQLQRLLKQAAQNKGPLELEVIRRGTRQVLSR